MSLAFRIATFLTVISILQGCAGLRVGGTADWPWGDKHQFCQAACTPNEALRTWSQAISFCRDVHNYYERGGQISGNARLGLGLFGVLAGSVFGITAGGSAAKAWSSVAGATNGLQTELDGSQLGAAARENRAAAVKHSENSYSSVYAHLTATQGGITSANANLIVSLALAVATDCHTGSTPDAAATSLWKAVPKGPGAIAGAAAGANAGTNAGAAAGAAAGADAGANAGAGAGAEAGAAAGAATQNR